MDSSENVKKGVEAKGVREKKWSNERIGVREGRDFERKKHKSRGRVKRGKV